MDKISVIIPVYNTEKHLERCIDSVLGQTYRNLEIILINDGSTDASEEICKKYAENDDRIVFINNENKGVSATRNAGIKKASGSFITFVDSDDWIEKDMYEKMLETIKEYQVDFCLCSAIFESTDSVDKKNNLLNEGDVKKENTNYFINRIYISKDIVFNLWNLLIRRDKIREIYMDENISIGEDSLYILQVLTKVNSGVLLNEFFYHYVQYSTSLSHNKNVSDKYFSGIISTEKQAEILKELYNETYVQFRYVILRDYVNACRLMSEKGVREKKWVDFIQKRIRKELIEGGILCKNQIKQTIISAIIISISFNCYYIIYRAINRSRNGE